MSEAEDLSRNALRIYFKLFESEIPLGVRELARDLNMPVSTVHYNLKRLEELGIIKKSSSGYIINKPMPLDGFLTIRRRLVPRLIIYSMFFFGITLGSIIITITSEINADRLLVIIVSTIASLIFLLEGLGIRRKFA